MMMRHRVVRVHLRVRMHAVVSLPGDHRGCTRALTFRAQHGRRHRTPDGEQDGHQDQDEDAEVFHLGDYRTDGPCYCPASLDLPTVTRSRGKHTIDVS